MNSILTRLALSLLLLALLTGCGFQLRGQVMQLSGLQQPLLVAGVTPDSPLGRELRDQLLQAGTQLTEDAAQAGATLRITHVHSGDRILGLDSRNRATEYELVESLRFRLLERQAGERMSEQQLRVTRTLFLPQTRVLAGQAEAETLREDMRRELVNRLIRRLAVLL